MASVTQLLTRR